VRALGIKIAASQRHLCRFFAPGAFATRTISEIDVSVDLSAMSPTVGLTHRTNVAYAGNISAKFK
jgi:hypothetical protein